MVYRLRFFRTAEDIGEFGVLDYTTRTKENAMEIGETFAGFQRLLRMNYEFVQREWNGSNADPFPGPTITDFPYADQHLQTWRWDFDGETFIIAVDTITTIEDGA